MTFALKTKDSLKQLKKCLKFKTAIKNLTQNLFEKMDGLTIHGVPRAFEGSRIKRLFWSVVVLIMTITTSIFLKNYIEAYYNYNVITTISTKGFNWLKFPTIWICNGASLGPNVDYNKIPLEAGFQSLMDNFTFFCMFNEKPCKHNIRRPHGYFNSCMVFNPDGKAKQTQPLHRGGLFLHIFVNTSEQYQRRKMSSHVNSEQNNGIILTIVAPEVFVKPDHSKIRLSTGTTTIIGIAKRRYKRLPHPYPSNCTKDGKEYDKFPGKYTKIGCYITCYAPIIKEKCNYTMEEWRFVVNGSFQPTHTVNWRCVGYYYNKFLQYGIDNCHCSIPCEEDKYKVTAMSVVPWPSERDKVAYIQEISKVYPNEVVDETFINKHIARIELSYDTFEVQSLVEHERYGIGSLLSDFGGIAGVCLGASFISFLEIFHALLTVAYNMLVHKQQPKNNLGKD